MEDLLVQKHSVKEEEIQEGITRLMSFKFCCPLCGKNYLTYNDNFGKYAKCRVCDYLFEIKEKTNITAAFKTTFIDKVLIHGSDLLFNEIDKLIVKTSILRKKQNIMEDGIVNYDGSELLFFTDYIVCELLKLEGLSKKTYREIVHNFLKMHFREFKSNSEEKYGKDLLSPGNENEDIIKQRARIGEYLSYLSNIAASWEAVIQYDKDNSLIFQAVEKVVERLNHYLFKGRLIPSFVDEAVELVQLFFANQIEHQRKFQKFILEEVIKVKKI